LDAGSIEPAKGIIVKWTSFKFRAALISSLLAYS